MYLAKRDGIKTRIAHICPIHDVKDMQSSSIVRAIYRRLATRMIVKYSTRIVFDSQGSLDNFRKIGDHDLRKESVIYPGIDLQVFARSIERDEVRRKYSLPLDRPLICYVARFMPHKNHDQVLRVADLLNRMGLRFHFALAGTHGTRLEALKRAVHGRSDVSLLIGLDDLRSCSWRRICSSFPHWKRGSVWLLLRPLPLAFRSSQRTCPLFARHVPPATVVSCFAPTMTKLLRDTLHGYSTMPNSEPPSEKKPFNGFSGILLLKPSSRQYLSTKRSHYEANSPLAFLHVVRKP